MRMDLLTNQDVISYVDKIQTSWYSSTIMFFKERKIKKYSAELRRKYGLTDCDMFHLLYVLLDRNKEYKSDSSLCRELMGHTVGDFLSILRCIDTNKVKPFYIWGILRSRNDPFKLLDFNAEAQIISILLECAVLLLAGEESRIEADIKGKGIVVCWQCAAKHSIERLKLISKIRDANNNKQFTDVASNIRERASAVIALNPAAEKQNNRYRHAEFQPVTGTPVAFVPYDYEPALNDETNVTIEAFNKLSTSVGLASVYSSWLKAL
jgi:hypothetical protein